MQLQTTRLGQNCAHVTKWPLVVKSKKLRDDQETSAFTLVEILVTVAIIALLIALLIPSLKGLLGSADSTKCISNLRSVGGLISAYAADNKNAIPAPWDGGKGQYWSDMLLPYMSSESDQEKKVFGCPLIAKDQIGTGGNIYGMIRTDQSASQNMYLPLHGVPSKIRQILLVDSLAKLGASIKQSYRVGGNGDNRLMHFRHSGAANMLFMDFHVESIKTPGLKNVLRMGGAGSTPQSNGWAFYDEQNNPQTVP